MEVETLSGHGQPLLGCEPAQGSDWACLRAIETICAGASLCVRYICTISSRCSARIFLHSLSRVAPLSACVM